MCRVSLTTTLVCVQYLIHLNHSKKASAGQSHVLQTMYILKVSIAPSGLQDREDPIGSSVQSKRPQVSNTWEEIQQIEEDMKTLASAASTEAAERHFRDIKVLENEMPATCF